MWTPLLLALGLALAWLAIGAAGPAHAELTTIGELSAVEGELAAGTFGPRSQAGVLGPLAELPRPTVETGAASEVTRTTATLNGIVNPNGSEVVKCKFQYGTTAAYGLSAPCSLSPGSGTSVVAVSTCPAGTAEPPCEVKGLTPGTEYHFRITAANASGTSKGADGTFKTAPAIAPTVETQPASAITGTAATLNGTVNPNGTEVNVSECEFEYGTTTSYGKTAPCSSSPGSGTSPVAVSAAVSGLAANSEYHFRLVARNGAGPGEGADRTFTTALPNRPAVVTGAATSVEKTSATLNATVNPEGAPVSECEFEYGTTTAYGKTAPCSSSPGSGTSPVAVSAQLTGLSANSEYHFRIVASNVGGVAKGEDETFTTTVPNRPVVVTRAASSITQTSATLNATVNPEGGVVSECKFEYGTTPSYGKSVACSSSPGSGTSPVAVSAQVTGLTANTEYHFRIVARNAGGVGEGGDGAFTTITNPPTVETKAASEITGTTAILNATVNPNGSSVSECKFEYGTTSSYGESVPCSSSPGSGTSPVAVSAEITGLKPKSEYHFRIVARNAAGLGPPGGDVALTTPDAPAVVTKPASSVGKTSAILNATVNPENGLVSECKFEYGTTPSYEKTAPCSPSPGSGTSPVAVSAKVTGLHSGSEYHFRIVARNVAGTSDGEDEAFPTLPPNAPAVATGAASPIAQTSATLSATVNPEEGSVETCEFLYGTTSAYGKSAPCSSSPGSGTSPVAVSAQVTGLTANTEYHFRIVAKNAGGMGKGEDATLATLPNAPAVITRAASAIGPTSASLNATVNPEGGAVGECKFEYGTTTSYDKSAPCSSSPGSGTSPVAVSTQITGLTANSEYHFRIVARNAGGGGEGSDQALRTLEPAPVGTTGPAETTSSPPPSTPNLPAGPTPVLGKSANVVSVAGKVTVRLPRARAFAALSTAARLVPYGTVINAVHGEVRVTAATANGGKLRGWFLDGEFVLTQGPKGKVTAALAGGNFSVCPNPVHAASVAKTSAKHVSSAYLVRRVWAFTGANFALRGNYAIGAVPTAQWWLTEDLCEGTLLLATHEHVEVSDLVRHQRLSVSAGKVYIAKP